MELLVSIVILAMVIQTFLFVYVYATKSNIHTDESVDGSYVVQSWMEKVYTISRSESVTDITTLENAINSDNSFEVSVSGSLHTLKKQVDGFYLMISINTATYSEVSQYLYKVVVRTYYDSDYSEEAAMMEDIINLNKE